MTTSGMTPEQAARLSLAEQHEWYKNATSRRTMLRGGLVGAAVIAGPALSVGSASASTGSTAPAASPSNSASLLQKADRPTGSTVAPFGRHLAYGTTPTSQISVAWQVPALVGNPFIRIGRSPGDLGHKIDAELKTLSTLASDTKPLDSVPLVSPTTIEQYYLHAAIKNLQPGETYYYTVGHDGWDPTANLAVVNSFTTAAAGRGPFTFTAFGDQGVTYDAARSTQQINGLRPAFHLHAGDVSYAEDTGHGLIADSYDPRVWDSFFTQVESVAATTPWQIAVGNHEMEAWYSPDGYGGQHSRFDFPSSQTTYYSFTYGNVAVLSLDANDVSYEIPANFGYSGGAQVAWINKTLAAYRADPSIDFIVAYFHHCAYSTCTSHASEGGAPVLRPAVRQVQRGPGHQRPQPHLRAQRPAEERRRHHGRADRQHHQARHRRHHLPGGRRRGRQPVRVLRRGQLRGLGRQRRVHQRLRQRDRRHHGRPERHLVAGALHRLRAVGRGQQAVVERGRQVDSERARRGQLRRRDRQHHPRALIPLNLHRG